MTASVLLVCGSRSLARDPAATAWARALLRDALGALAPGDVVLAGGAPGPDRWAQEVVSALARDHRPLRFVEFLADGRRKDWRPAGRSQAIRHTRWSPDNPGPLARNCAMIDALLAARAKDCLVSVLALVDPMSPTHGTDHTVAQARACGIAVVRAAWSAPAAEVAS